MCRLNSTKHKYNTKTKQKYKNKYNKRNVIECRQRTGTKPNPVKY